MDIEHFVKKESIIDLSFFNFSNAVTAAYFASSDLKVLKVNNNFKKFFPILKNVNNVYFPSILEQLGVKDELINQFENTLRKDGRVIIPKIQIYIDGEEKVLRGS